MVKAGMMAEEARAEAATADPGTPMGELAMVGPVGMGARPTEAPSSKS
jgi:hypothetical protein